MSATDADYNTELGVSSAASIAGKYVTSVRAAITTAQTATTDGIGMIAVKFNTMIPSVSNMCYHYVGTCVSGVGMKWSVAVDDSASPATSSSCTTGMPTKFLPKL